MRFVKVCTFSLLAFTATSVTILGLFDYALLARFSKPAGVPPSPVAAPSSPKTKCRQSVVGKTQQQHQQRINRILTQAAFEAQLRLSLNSTSSVEDEECTPERCPNCHLNSTCFDYHSDVWRPDTDRCPNGRRFDSEQVSRCFSGDNRTVLFVGDSRIRHLFSEVAALIDLKHFRRRTTGQKMQTIKSGSFIRTDDMGEYASNRFHARTWSILPEIRKGRYDLGYLWHLLKDPVSELQEPLDNLARQNGSKYLILGGNVPWILGLYGENTFHPKRFSLEIEQGQNRLNQTMRLVKSKRTDEMDVIFIQDMPPVFTKQNGANWSVHKKLLEGTANITWSNRRLMETEFPFVKTMDSHLVAHRAFLDICNRGNVTDWEEDDPTGTAGTYHRVNDAWNCQDRWHPGRLFQMGVAQLVLNHICRDEEEFT